MASLARAAGWAVKGLGPPVVLSRAPGDTGEIWVTFLHQWDNPRLTGAAQGSGREMQ